MRIVKFAISLVITLLLIFALNHRWNIGGKLTPRLGYFLSPQHGFWQNAENKEENFSLDLRTPLLQDKVDVYLDDRLVPHVFAQNEHDAYFVQGYLHAKFRLWQMEFQTHYAAGRAAEFLGRKAGKNDVVEQHDRNFRRLGMVWAAENSLKEMEANPDTKNIMDAYTAGINLYVGQLRPEDYPVEYKLLNYAPEKWSNLKTALFLKYMSYDLAGYEKDFERTALLSVLTRQQYEQAFPYGQDSLSPIIPHDTAFGNPTIALKVPPNADSVYFTFNKDSVFTDGQKPNPANGSNNWAVAGSKTASGRPILCGDPHLGLNLPSLWFEIQLHTPEWNTYGVSFPGAPAVAIGFNDSIAWSETNAMRDVKDYYEIRFKDASQNEYWFGHEWLKTGWRYDTVKVLGEPDVIDSIAMTVIGPVMYDKNYENPLHNGKAYAVRWKAHEGSNEEWTFIKLARAKNYNDYLDAIKTFECPGQNFVFAAKNGDIAMWCQGAFPSKWRRQGDFLMPGTNGDFLWQGMIAPWENPHQLNPARGFVSSANQYPVDTTYPYYLGGVYEYSRGSTINQMLSQMNGITPVDMQRLQNNNYNIFAAHALPLLLRHVYDSTLQKDEKQYVDTLKAWNFYNEASFVAPAVFVTLMSNLSKDVWSDEFRNIVDVQQQTHFENVLIEALEKDTAFAFLDDKNTQKKETLADMILLAVQQTAQQLGQFASDHKGKLNWQMLNEPQVNHLLKLLPFSRANLPTGGGRDVINAIHGNHGPSWRMVVQMTDKTKAYGVYPGGQSGNPGSRFYDSFVYTWAAGQYFSLWIMTEDEKTDSRVKWTMHFGKG